MLTAQLQPFAALQLSPTVRRGDPSCKTPPRPRPSRENHFGEDPVSESSSKQRRGGSGKAIALDEENNPSPTRLQQRRSAPSFDEAPRTPGAVPLTDPRILTLRSGVSNVPSPCVAMGTRAATLAWGERAITPTVLRRHESVVARIQNAKQREPKSGLMSPLAKSSPSARGAGSTACSPMPID